METLAIHISKLTFFLSTDIARGICHCQFALGYLSDIPSHILIDGLRDIKNHSIKRGLPLVAFAILLGMASAPAYSRALERGGRIDVYLAEIRAETRRHIISGDCMSACTMWLGYANTCVMKDAVLWFHAATDRLQAMRTDNPWRSISEGGNQILLAMYPRRIRAVVEPWLLVPEFHTLTGLEAASLGVPLCGTDG